MSLFKGVNESLCSYARRGRFVLGLRIACSRAAPWKERAFGRRPFGNEARVTCHGAEQNRLGSMVQNCTSAMQPGFFTRVPSSTMFDLRSKHKMTKDIKAWTTIN